MAQMNIEELERELNATAETYIRRKLTTGGYPQTHRKYVVAWLEQRERDQAEKTAADNLAVARRSVFWSKVAAVGTLVGGIVAVAAFYASKGL